MDSCVGKRTSEFLWMNGVHSTGRLNTNWFMSCILTIDTHSNRQPKRNQNQTNSLFFILTVRWFWISYELVSGFLFLLFVCCVVIHCYSIFVCMYFTVIKIIIHHIISRWSLLQINNMHMAHSMDWNITLFVCTFLVRIPKFQ